MPRCFACGSPTTRKGLTLHDYTFKKRYACPACYPRFETVKDYREMKKAGHSVKLRRMS